MNRICLLLASAGLFAFTGCLPEKESDKIAVRGKPLSGAVMAQTNASTCVRELLEFREGTNFRGFRAFDGKGPCSVRVEKGKLRISGKMDTLGFVPFVYEPQKPFPGPSKVVLQTESSPKGGRAVLRLKERTRGAQPLTFEAAWTGGLAAFDTELDFGKEYEFVSLDLGIPNGKSAVQNVTVEKLEGVFHTDAVHACSFEVVTKSPLHTLDWHSKETAVAVFRNRTAKPLSVSGNLTVSDFYGRSFSIPVKARIEGKSWGKKEISLPREPGKVDAKGVWRVVAALKGEDGSEATFEDRFAVLDEHPVTPKVPYGKFRAGIHCHSARWLDGGRDLTHDAAVRMGAKIVRIDDVFSQFSAWNAKKNGFDFTKADRFLEGLEERGLAVDAIILGNGSFKNFTEDFCEQLARHYGERIDYYEIGNEWDLLPRERLTPEKGVEWQKLAYRGLKKGNPKARVTTNGWAVEDSNGHANVTQKGFQETFMKEAKGAYDIHAMHLHFPFQNYVDRMGRFFRLREACGVTAPFLLNETALNVQYRGEEEVAENVWLKIIYGWAHGATDYVWYNMRASGYDPGGTYGVVNREFRPRLTFAAFSGFTAALGEHDFDRILVEKEGRKVYRFKHRAGRELVIAGWDTGLLKPIEIRVKTDARKVWIADIMNNRREVAVMDGTAMLVLSGAPQAWVFEGATFAKPAEAILSPTKAPPRVIHVSPVRPDYGWDMLLDRYAQVHEEYPADPATAHRTWKGKDDCSGIALFKLKDGRANLYISVRDEKDAPGDTVQVWRDGKDVTPALKFVRTRHGDNRTTYEAAWPDLETCRINVRFIDDDGFGGIDGWVDYTPFDAKKPDATAWPVLRFE